MSHERVTWIETAGVAVARRTPFVIAIAQIIQPAERLVARRRSLSFSTLTTIH